MTEAVKLIADMDRMGLVRRLRVDRFTQAETRTFLAAVLGGPVDANSAAVMHATGRRACRSSSRRWRTPIATPA